MQFDHYMSEYAKFDANFFPNATLEEVEHKMREEMSELNVELICQGDIKNRISEALDVMNLSLKLLNRYGVKNPLHMGYKKLQQTAEKYRNAKLQLAK